MRPPIGPGPNGGRMQPPIGPNPNGGGRNMRPPIGPGPNGGAGGGKMRPPIGPGPNGGRNMQPPIGPNGPRGGGEDEEKKEPEKEVTGIRVTQPDKLVTFTVSLVLDNKDREKLEEAAGLVLHGLKGELDLSSGENMLQRLAQAVKQLGETDKQFPQAALFRRPAPERSGYEWEPDQRISWLAKLLTALGHDVVVKKINWEKSWSDKENWLAARILIPEFVDAAYPASSRYVRYPGIPIEVAATHFVGIAGIGEDAASEKADAPEAAKRRGLLGYEKDRVTPLSSPSLERGADKTVLMAQVPPGIGCPWLAGGGSTVRGVPETRSLDPFVAIQVNGESGTHVLMANGSVYFVTNKTAPDAFKALCAIKGAGAIPKDWKQVFNAAEMKAKAPAAQ
jgi:hypothetical protein